MTAWQSTNGPMIVEHVGGVSPDGTLSVFWWSPAHDWQALNVPRSPAVPSTAGRSLAHRRRRARRRARQQRPAVRVLVDACDELAPRRRDRDHRRLNRGGSAAYRVSETGANVELLSARGVDDALLRFWWRPNRAWQAQI